MKTKSRIAKILHRRQFNNPKRSFSSFIVFQQINHFHLQNSWQFWKSMKILYKTLSVMSTGFDYYHLETELVVSKLKIFSYVIIRNIKYNKFEDRILITEAEVFSCFYFCSINRLNNFAGHNLELSLSGPTSDRIWWLSQPELGESNLPLKNKTPSTISNNNFYTFLTQNSYLWTS